MAKLVQMAAAERGQILFLQNYVHISRCMLMNVVLHHQYSCVIFISSSLPTLFFFFFDASLLQDNFAHLVFLDEEHKSICSFLHISFSFSSKTTICVCYLVNDWLVNVLLCSPKSPQVPYKPAQLLQTLLMEKIHDSFCELLKYLWCVSILEDGE